MPGAHKGAGLTDKESGATDTNGAHTARSPPGAHKGAGLTDKESGATDTNGALTARLA